MSSKHKITPFLWFDANAEEAASFYVSMFENSEILTVNRMGARVLTVTFQLAGQEFVALNGGPQFKFTEAISLLVDCDDPGGGRRVSGASSRPTAGRRASAAGSRTSSACPGRSSPPRSSSCSQDKDPVKAGRVMQAMLQMKKFDIARLEKAYRGE